MMTAAGAAVIRSGGVGTEALYRWHPEGGSLGAPKRLEEDP